MADASAGQDLQARLENPVPSSVPSKHLFFSNFKLRFQTLAVFWNLGHWQSTSASDRSWRRKRLHLAVSTFLRIRMINNSIINLTTLNIFTRSPLSPPCLPTAALFWLIPPDHHCYWQLLHLGGSTFLRISNSNTLLANTTRTTLMLTIIINLTTLNIFTEPVTRPPLSPPCQNQQSSV